MYPWQGRNRHKDQEKGKPGIAVQLAYNSFLLDPGLFKYPWVFVV